MSPLFLDRLKYPNMKKNHSFTFGNGIALIGLQTPVFLTVAVSLLFVAFLSLHLRTSSQLKHFNWIYLSSQLVIFNSLTIIATVGLLFGEDEYLMSPEQRCLLRPFKQHSYVSMILPPSLSCTLHLILKSQFLY